MGQYFLIKEVIETKKTSLIGEVDADSYNEAIDVAKECPHPGEIVYLVEVVAKLFGDMKT